MDEHTAGRDAVEGRVALPFSDGGAPEWMMWMPGGVHTINASKCGRPLTLTMSVDARGSDTMQRALRKHLSAGKQRPWLDFDHKGEAASGWLIEFAWRQAPEPGIYARVEWSEAGRAAIEGKAYRAFSPKWYETDSDPSEVDGAPLNMGGLVNDPAFKQIAPFWAKDNSGQAAVTGDNNSSSTQQTSMTPTPTELAAAQSRIAELEAKNSELEGKIDVDVQAAKTEAEEARAALEAAKREADALKAESESRRKRDAEACVASAVSRGAIAPKDEVTAKKWTDLIYADPRNADLLSKLPGKVALTAGMITRPAVEIIKADTKDLLRGFIMASNPRERGAFFRKELSPLIDKGENITHRIPVEATNTLGTLINTLVSQRTLELVVSKRPQLKGVVTDFSDEVKALNDVVKTRTIGLPTVQTFGGTVSATADTDVTVTLDLHKEVRYTFTAAEVVGTSRNLVAERSEAMAVALGNSMVDALAALCNESNFGTGNQTIKATASTDFTTITAIAKAMNVAGVPDTYRFGWVNSSVAEALRNDEIVMANFDRGPLASAYGHWTNLVGFNDVWEYPALPNNSVNLTGFFGSRSALIIASRIPRDPSSISAAGYPGILTVVTDPVTGLSVLNNEFVAADTFDVNCRMICLYGVDLGQASCGHTLVSAA